MAITEERPEAAGKRKVDAFVFDCVCHIFNFDKRNAIGPSDELFDEHLYGGEAPIWHPQWALEEFWNFELPRDIVEERGYPQLTEQAKRKILGGNLARLHGMEVPST
jgi:predicted TIM-barrel fold metal-dependent hydrolase